MTAIDMNELALIHYERRILMRVVAATSVMVAIASVLAFLAAA